MLLLNIFGYSLNFLPLFPTEKNQGPFQKLDYHLERNPFCLPILQVPYYLVKAEFGALKKTAESTLGVKLVFDDVVAFVVLEGRLE